MARFRLVALFILFAALTSIVTYPQVTGIATLVPFNSDPYFSMWRLGWVAHQIPHGWTNFFDGNIFYPERLTLAYSDAMLLPGVALAPFFWVGVNPVTIYNLTLLGSMALSGVAAALLTSRLTASMPAGIVAGAIYAFAPYRFDHYIHLEFQIVFWVPLALLVLHRSIESARSRDVWILGGLVAAQTLSCLYVALFFATYSIVVGPLILMLSVTAVRRLRILGIWTMAAVVALVVASPYAVAYSRAEAVVGARSLASVSHYGATMWSYRSTPPTNRLFGREGARPGSPEHYLFPGYMALGLAAVGLVASRDRRRWAYVAGLLLAFEISRGLNGFLFLWLWNHVGVYQALRVPPRMAILVNLSLAVLASYGVAWILSWLPERRWQRIATTLAVVLIVVEYASAPGLTPAPEVSRIDRWLERRPPSVIVELPVASQRGGSSLDWLYMYEGIRHRQRMLNGYSGYAPASYYSMIDEMVGFPDDRSLELLRARGVDLVILRGEEYPVDEWEPLIARARARQDLSLVTTLPYKDRFQAVFAVTRDSVGRSPAPD